MTKKRRNGHSRRRSFSESDVHTRAKKAKLLKEDISVSTSAAAVAHFQALQSCSSSAALADVFEWLGDAVIGELVGRCLLSQFHQAPLSARVFRNLRLAVVTNRNLAQVYDAMADVVEAVVGELVLKLHQRKDDSDGYRAHLDMVLASMLHCHFTERSQASKEKGETVMAAKGPLSVAFNPFTCLPEEQLDEITGELIVTQGVEVFEVIEEEISFVDEYKGAEVESTDTTRHHYFSVGNGTIKEETVRLAMVQLDEMHILRTSREIFEVFKIYEDSLSLALPNVSLQIKRSEMVTPARLTRQRQLVLSVANLAKCAISLELHNLFMKLGKNARMKLLGYKKIWTCEHASCVCGLPQCRRYHFDVRKSPK
ncbi:Ribonuclease III domain [Phytophthora cactorum]|nr:Ribonuclease III domain [Phytophthora cactorum]